MKLPYIAITALVLLVGAGVYLVVQNDNEGRMQELQAEFDRKLQQQERLLKEKLESDAKAAAERAKVEIAAAKTAAENTAKAIPGVGENLQNDPGVQSGLQNVKDTVAAVSGENSSARAESTLSAEELRIKQAEADLLNSTGVGADRIAIETGKLTGAIPDEESERLNDIQSLILAQPRIARVKDSRPAESAGFIELDEGLNKGLAKGDRFAVRRGTILVARIVVSDTVQATSCIADIAPNSIPTGMTIKNGDDIIKFDR